MFDEEPGKIRLSDYEENNEVIDKISNFEITQITPKTIGLFKLSIIVVVGSVSALFLNSYIAIFLMLVTCISLFYRKNIYVFTNGEVVKFRKPLLREPRVNTFKTYHYKGRENTEAVEANIEPFPGLDFDKLSDESETFTGTLVEQGDSQAFPRGVFLSNGEPTNRGIIIKDKDAMDKFQEIKLIHTI